MKEGKNKIILIASLALVAVAAVVLMVTRAAGEGDTQTNVAEFAKSIDATKKDTPSVPPDRLALGRMGGKKQ